MIYLITYSGRFAANRPHWMCFVCSGLWDSRFCVGTR